jgi:pimeloyl-ACP methyl ester carboxylesterase
VGTQPDEVAGTLIIGNDRLFLRTFPKLLNAKGLQMPQITVHGLDVYYRDEGSGIPILLGHSSTGSGGQWRALFTQMADQYRLVAPDHIGYGRTAAFAGQMPLIGHEIAIIEALLEELAQPVHLVGHSYGGAILARTAVRVPEKVRSLTLYEPTLFHLLAPAGKLAEHDEIKSVADRVIHYVSANNAEEAARGFIDYWVSPGAYETMDERLRHSVKAGMPKLQVEWSVAFDPSGATVEALSGLRLPVQLIAGSRTTSAAGAVTDILRHVWPNAAYAEIDGAGHMGPVTHPAAVNEIIANFVARSI